MADITIEPIKKVTRTRKAVAPSDNLTAQTTSLIAEFELQINRLAELKNSVEKLEREIEQTKQDWSKEQKAHEQGLVQRKEVEEISRQRDQETYNYEISLARKKLKDELEARREEIEADKKELADLRKLTESFPAEKDKATKDAVAAAQKSVTDQLETEKKLREQEVKSQIEVLNLKISSLESENSRQAKEIESLKKSLDEATRQVKDIAIQVIQSKRPESSS